MNQRNFNSLKRELKTLTSINERIEIKTKEHNEYLKQLKLKTI